jgi:hypothetical protein
MVLVRIGPGKGMKCGFVSLTKVAVMPSKLPTVHKQLRPIPSRDVWEDKANLSHQLITSESQPPTNL